MKTKIFKIKSINRTVLILTALPIIFALLFFGFVYFMKWIFTSGNQYIAIIATLAIVFGVFTLCKKIATRNYIVTINKDRLTVTKVGSSERSLQLNQITKLAFRTHQQGCLLIIEASGFEFAKFDVSLKQAQQIQDIIEELQQYNSYNVVEGKDQRGVWTNYVNPNAVNSTPASFGQVYRNQVNSKRKTKWVGIAISLAVMAVLIAPFFINPKAFYDSKDGKVYFGSKELVGVDPQKTTILSYHVLKDSTHVYYKDRILEWADYATFQCLREPFYMDKNGIYFETSNFYTPNKIKPLEGEYDAATFRSVDGYASTLFKDKNNLYEIDVFGQPPLRKITFPGLDVESFQGLENNYWFADKNHVYFAGEGDLKQCKEIDRASFEILSLQVVKDKNRVYFLTYHLKSEHGVAGEHKGYKVLEGADAPTFQKLDDKRFVDKNEVWTISSEEEKKEPKATRREDVK
ncbi:DKNYY domain-containing protein [Bacteroides sp. 519]|uniref:DKNYY domain-containing protein n=1 Tax=Bacteroides sp. 519 TaxID=2302937 RepID=UPI0013D070F4|nr:DKNYY domain-containing protein [Bacteroides sp. 519]NDV59476.1 hypothetical protein [Bacteroides sp. 519]